MLEWALSLVIAFALGAAWRSLYPVQVVVIEESKIKDDEPSRLDEDAGISLAQAQHHEEILKQKHREQQHQYHYTANVELK